MSSITTLDKLIDDTTTELILENCELSINEIMKTKYTTIKKMVLINVKFTNKLFNINFANFPNLEYLKLERMVFYDMSLLHPLKHLKILKLDKNDIDTLDFDLIPKQVEYMSLNNNPISDINYEVSNLVNYKLKELHIENILLRDKPHICGIDIKYSYDTNVLKICDMCINQIFNLEKYYNKDNDGYYLCEDCYESHEEPGFIKKTNMYYDTRFCDEIECERKRNSELPLHFQKNECAWVSYFENHIICAECYEKVDYEDLYDYIEVNMDYLTKTKYKYNNDYDFCLFENENEKESMNIINYTIEDIEPHNHTKFANCIFDKINKSDPIEYADIQSLIYLKEKFPKIDLNRCDESKLNNLFTSGNYYIISYFIKNMKISLKSLKRYFWNIVETGNIDTLYFLTTNFTYFFNRVNLLKNSEISGKFMRLIETDSVNIIFFLLDYFKVSLRRYIVIDQEKCNEFALNNKVALMGIVSKKNVNYQLSVDHILNTGDLDDPDTYDTIEYLYDLNEQNIQFNFMLNCRRKKFLENIFNNIESVDLIRDAYIQQNRKTSIKITLPYDIFIEKCKENNVKFAQIMVEFFGELIFIELDNDEIIDYGKHGSGLFENPLPKFKNIVKLECCICMDNVSTIITKCTHQFCKRCIKKSVDNSEMCPLCRQNIKGKLYYINDNKGIN